jgi:cell division control protein 45
MDIDLKTSLIQKLQAIAPEYGLLELLYPSFIRCYGYRSQPLSASDAVEAIGALLDVAGGVRMEIEVEGGRGGGEWFGRGGVWEVGRREGIAADGSAASFKPPNEGEEGEEVNTENSEVPWHVHNFWKAFDALSE